MQNRLKIGSSAPDGQHASPRAWMYGAVARLPGKLPVFAWLLGTGWLLWHILRQQGRLLLRIEATEAHLASTGRASQGEQVGGSVTGHPVHVHVGKAIMEVPDERLWAFPGGRYYEKNVAFWLQKLVLVAQRKVVYDIGANCGYYCLLLAPEASGIYAFEPVASTYAVLKKNIEANHLGNVTAYPLGIFQTAGSAEIHLYSSSGRNSLFARNLSANQPAKLIGREVIRLASLDAFIAEECLDPPGLLKIDIEGGKLFALKGARETIKAYQPIIVAEYGEKTFRDAGYRRCDLLRELEEHHYRIFGIPKAAQDFNVYPQDSFEEVTIDNLIAVPEGMQEVLQHPAW